jgi:hypothetical protein
MQTNSGALPPSYLISADGFFFRGVKLWGLEVDHLSRSDNDVEQGSKYFLRCCSLQLRDMLADLYAASDMKESPSWIILLRLHLQRGPSVLENVFLVIAKKFFGEDLCYGQC